MAGPLHTTENWRPRLLAAITCGSALGDLPEVAAMQLELIWQGTGSGAVLIARDRKQLPEGSGVHFLQHQALSLCHVNTEASPIGPPREGAGTLGQGRDSS